MRYYLDTEFIERPCTIDLISIGVVAEDGREFYQCNRDANLEEANEWVVFNVFPSLPLERGRDRDGRPCWKWKERNNREGGRLWSPDAIAVPRYEIRHRLIKFIGDDPNPEFWGYYADYDWVAFCWLFGRMVDLPKGWPMYCRDLKQLSDHYQVPKFPERNSDDDEHHALKDAWWNLTLHQWIANHAQPRGVEL